MLKKIVLHTAALDNLGGYHDAGAELVVGDDAAAGFLNSDRAKDLIEGHRAVSATAEQAANDDGLGALGIAQLKELATREGVVFGEKPTKHSLLDLIRADRVAKAAAAATQTLGSGAGEGSETA